eukprot:5333189-Prorocentrum_lima.AAC.1
MTSSLVGSEMCIRDSFCRVIWLVHPRGSGFGRRWRRNTVNARGPAPCFCCLLYTSDAADDM